jgi:hypothetical protein
MADSAARIAEIKHALTSTGKSVSAYAGKCARAYCWGCQRARVGWQRAPRAARGHDRAAR